MAPVRTIFRLPRARISPVGPFTRRYATQSYGGDESGHPGSKEAPRRDAEHPGPPAPDVSKGSSQASSQQSSTLTSTSTSQSSSQSDKGRPAIHQPKSAAEEDDPEVKKHNEEMRNRAEVSANQLAEKDNKVS
jgi:hypothetical protein